MDGTLPLPQELSAAKLRIGDVIFLKLDEGSNTDGQGCLCAEGHLGDNVFLSSKAEDFHYGLWEVYVQYQYSSFSEYDEGIQNNMLKKKEDSGDDEHSLDEFDELFAGEMTDGDPRARELSSAERQSNEVSRQIRRAAINEQAINEKTFSMKVGTPVQFGDVLQLRHVASRKFLAVSTSQLAKQERENMRVNCIQSGNALSAIVLVPKQSFGGDRVNVLNNQEVHIKIHERPGEFLRGAKPNKNNQGKHGRGEANCSLEKTSWVINVYQSTSKHNIKEIFPGRLVSLSDSETHSMLTVQPKIAAELKSHTITSPSVGTYNESKDKGQVVMQGRRPESTESGVNCLWRIEKKLIVRGGNIRLTGDLVVLCHLNSNMYLHSRSSDGSLLVVSDRSRATEFDMSLPITQTGMAGMKMITHLEEGCTVSMATVVGFGQKKLGLGTSPLYLSVNVKKTSATTELIVQPDVTAALTFNVSNKIQTQVGADIYFGIECCNCLYHFRDLAAELKPDEAFDSPSMVTASQSFNALTNCLQEVVTWLFIKDMNKANVKVEDSFGSKPPSLEVLRVRQGMLREQGVVDAILLLLNECLTGKYDRIKAAGSAQVNLHQALAGLGPRGSRGSILEDEDDNESGSGSGSDAPKSRKNSIKGKDDKKSAKHDASPVPSDGKFGGLTRMFSAGKTNTKDDSSKKRRGSKDESRGSIVGTVGAFFGRNMSATNLATKKKKSKGSDSNSGSSSGSGSDSDSDSDSTSSSDDSGDFNTNGTQEEVKPTAIAKPVPARTATRRMSSMTVSKPVVNRSLSQMPTSVTSRGEAIMSVDGSLAGQRDDNKSSRKQINTKKQTVSMELADALLRALALCIYNNASSQLHVSENMSILLKHVTTQEYAVYCLQELFKDNQAILQTKIRQKEIDIFINLLNLSEMNVSFLKLLQSTCTCPHGIDSTQRMVAVSLFGVGDNEARSIENGSPTPPNSADQRRLILKMYADSDTHANKKCIWMKHGVHSYFPPRNSPEFNAATTGILGFDLLVHGLPETYVSWDAINNSKSMIKLFGAPDRVPFHLLSASYKKEFYVMRMKFVQNSDARVNKKAILEAQRRTSSLTTTNYSKVAKDQVEQSMSHRATTVQMKKKGNGFTLSSDDEYKSLIAEYMLTELYLVADLCLDRNYVAIRILEAAFPYDMLLTVLRDQKVDDAFKAPICRILRCLWIDREPQTVAVFPRLIRSSKATKEGGSSSGFTKHHKGSPYSFCLLQQTIADYFRSSFSIDECNELSVEMSEMALMLMKFGFYSNDDNLRDITFPLVKLVDHSKHLKGTKESILADGKARKESIWNGSDSETKTHPDGSMTDLSKEGFDLDHHHDNHLAQFTENRKQKYQVNNNEASLLRSAWIALSSWMPWSLSYGAKIVPQKPKHETLHEILDDVSDTDDLIDLDQGKIAYRTNRQMLANKRKEEDRAATNENMWESKYLMWSDSVVGMLLVMSVVTLTVTVSIFQITTTEEDVDGTAQRALDSIDEGCSIFFVIELWMRAYCVARVQGLRNGAIVIYFTNIMNFLDLVLVILDITLYSLGVDGGAGVGAARASKIVKGIRFIRLIRVLRVVRIMNLLKDKASRGVAWVVPTRFEVVTKLKAQTMTAIVRNLCVVFDRMQDNSLEMVINSFQAWVETEKKIGQVTDVVADPDEYIQSFMNQDDSLGLLPPGFEKVLADTIMYSDAQLCHESFNLLRKVLDKGNILSLLAKDIQIVFSPKVELKLKEAKDILQSMRRNAEMYEIWQDLDIEENYETAEQLNTMIKTLSNMMRKSNDDRTLSTKMEFIPDEEVQNLLRNLDALHVFMTVLEALYDGGREELNEKIIKIMRNCIQMVCLFVDKNDRNQQLAFQKMSFFLDTLNDGINSADCMHYILQGNNVLVKNCHKRFVEEFAQLIFTHGQKPEYMRVFAAMTVGLNDQDSNMKSVQNNISRFLTSREWQTRILLWCCASDSNAYAQRAYAMSQYPDNKNRPIPLEDLSSDLQYHILLLNVMARCNLGPKLQAIYQLDDIVFAIIDKKTIFPVRIALGRCLEQLVCNGADLFISSEYMWLFFEHFVEYAAVMDRELTELFRRPLSSHTCLMKKQTGEWMEICLTIVTIFFAVLDMSIFGEVIDHDIAVKRTQRSEIEIQAIIKKLYHVIRSFLDGHILHVGPIIMERGQYALVSLCRHNSGLTFDFKDGSMRLAPKKARGSVTLADVQQLQLRYKFATFTERMQDDKFNSNDASVKFFASLPPIVDTGNHDVRLEPFIKKLVDHIRSNIVDSAANRTLTSNYEESIWLMKTLRRLFEKHLKQSVEFSIDVNLAQCENNKQTDFWRKTFNDCGVTELCLDFIAVGIETPLTLEAINLLVVLLARSDGCLEIQTSIYKSLKNRDSSPFFLQLKEVLADILSWFQKEAELIETQPDDIGENVLILPDENSIFTLIQLMCTGDYLPLKNYMREQDGNSAQVNIPSILASILDYLSRRESPLFTHMTVYVVHTIRLLMHGPCRGNQIYFIMGTEVLISLNRLIRLSRPKTQLLTMAWNLNIERLKESIIDVLRSCVEGFLKNSPIYDRIMSCIELNVLSMLLMPGEDEAHDVLEFGFTDTEAKYLIFLSFLERQSYLDGLHTSCIVKSTECIRFVEVLWEGAIHRLYFKVPNIVESLSKVYLNTFQELDGTSQEEILTGFLGSVKALFVEAKHQQKLTQYGISYLWSRKIYLSWFIFSVGCAINLMLLIYYHRNHLHEVHMGEDRTVEEEDVTYTMHVLIFVEIFASITMCLLYITVRMPANYLSNIETGHSKLRAIGTTLSDPLVWWYIVLLILSILGYTKDPIFCVAFMLEWVVLDNTTQKLLEAVSIPARQLVATLTILVIVIHIFSGIYFALFYHDMETNHVEPIYDLFSSLKLALTYGLRGEYGVDHEFHTTLGPRMILDLTFYFIVLATLRHIFFAIIVETFGQLREINNERVEKLHHSCFICGIERHDFEKAGLSTNFHHHREHVHSIENYVHFIFAVLEQKPHDDLGIEMHVRKCIANMDISWIPIGLDSFYASVRQSKEVEDNLHHHDLKNSAGMSSGAIENVPTQKKAEQNGGREANVGDGIARGIEEKERPRSNSRAVMDNEMHSIQIGDFLGGPSETDGALERNEILRAIQNIGLQINGIGTRLDALESGGNVAGIVSDVGVLSTVTLPGRAGGSSPGRAPRASISQVRSQLRGPSEASLMSQLPNFAVVANEDAVRPIAEARPTTQPAGQIRSRDLARNEETKDYTR